jgi:hypothetical protein
VGGDWQIDVHPPALKKICCSGVLRAWRPSAVPGRGCLLSLLILSETIADPVAPRSSKAVKSSGSFCFGRVFAVKPRILLAVLNRTIGRGINALPIQFFRRSGPRMPYRRRRRSRLSTSGRRDPSSTGIAEGLRRTFGDLPGKIHRRRARTAVNFDQSIFLGLGNDACWKSDFLNVFSTVESPAPPEVDLNNGRSR